LLTRWVIGSDTVQRTTARLCSAATLACYRNNGWKRTRHHSIFLTVAKERSDATQSPAAPQRNVSKVNIPANDSDEDGRRTSFYGGKLACSVVHDDASQSPAAPQGNAGDVRMIYHRCDDGGRGPSIYSSLLTAAINSGTMQQDAISLRCSCVAGVVAHRRNNCGNGFEKHTVFGSRRYKYRYFDRFHHLYLPCDQLR